MKSGSHVKRYLRRPLASTQQHHTTELLSPWLSRLEKKVAKKKEQLGRLQVQSKSKDALKTVALGTSKINYLDPRITVAWCKRSEVPIEKIFNKSLLSKFHWAMECPPDFGF